MDELLKYDKEFSESKFKTKVDNVFVMLHISYMTKNLDRVKHFLSDDVYKKYKDKLNELNNMHVIQMYDELNVKSTEIVDVNVMEDKFVIKVMLISRYMDYLINDTTREFVSGNNSSRVERTNYLTFEKIRDYKDQGYARKCPGCGANIDVNNSGKCTYCGAIYNNQDYDWILVDIETL